MSDPEAASHHDAHRAVEPRAGNVSPFLVALAGWLLPGMGYWLIGQRARATIAGLTILLTFAAGVLIGGIRVVDVPGYREGGIKAMIVAPTPPGAQAPPPRWILAAQPMQAVFQKPWYIGQILAGPVAILASYGSIEAASRQIPKGTAHVAEFGTLYCAIAGMMNLLIIVDSTARAVGAGSRLKDEG